MALLPLDLDTVEDTLRRDPEFLLHSRYLSATLRVVIGELQSFRLVIQAGRISEIDPVVTPFDSYDIQLAGTEAQWQSLLTATPPPFYQDFYPAMVHHGFRIEGDMETIFAYYPALRRLAELFREVANTNTAPATVAL
ncbi:hypothetical protein [Pseudonocardia spinosispora]|uniref:hypothetical protein n=1 Tax=Pseudonocardia spinosispora TaxID=103441 RepID=UPI0003FE98C9|nr:hypothetical protein [Pseudonocardia spinosispora]